MPRAIWSGAISFGLVNIPVKLFSAVNRKTVRFHQLDGDDNGRIAQKRVNPRTGEEVPFERVVKGYEIGPDRYVVVTPEEIDAVAPERTRTIEIEDFVDLDEIDPIFYDHPYYLAPDKGAERAYRLLLDAMREAGKVAIARVVIRSKEQLVAIRPRDDALTMETMLFADEVIDPDNLDELPDADAKPTSERELGMAQQLIDSLSGDFDPAKYHDEYRERVLELIERKAQGEEVVLEAPPEEPAKAPDLMAALEASIAAAKGQGGGRRRAPAKGRDGDGAGPEPAKRGRGDASAKGSSSRSSGRRKAAKKN
ncbi:MAG: Ku protein [Nocardioidaceae bacterium]